MAASMNDFVFVVLKHMEKGTVICFFIFKNVLVKNKHTFQISFTDLECNLVLSDWKPLSFELPLFRTGGEPDAMSLEMTTSS